MAFHYGPNGQQYIKITMYTFQCDIGNHTVKDAIGACHCSKCGRQSCHAHLKHYGCCAGCWSSMSPAEQVAQKKAYRKAQGIAMGLVTISLVFLFGFPFTYWLISESTEYLLHVFFIGMACWLFMLCRLVNRQRQKAGLKSIWQELHHEVKSTPPMDNKSKKILKIVFLIFALLIVLIIVVASVIMADFNAQWD